MAVLNLPEEEIEMDILSRLTVESLLRFSICQRQRFLFLVFIVLSPPSEAAEAGRMSDYNTVETSFHFIKRFGSSRRRRLDGLKEMDGRSCGVVAMLFKKCVIPNDVKYCRSFFEDLSKNCINYEDLVRKADIGEEGKLDHLNHSIMTNNKAPCEALTKLYQECTSKLGRDHVACRYYNKDLGRYCHDAVWKRIFGGTLSQYWGGGKVDLKTSA